MLIVVGCLLLIPVTAVLTAAAKQRLSDGSDFVFSGGPLVSGELHTGPEPDWSFTNDIVTIERQLEDPSRSHTIWVGEPRSSDLVESDESPILFLIPMLDYDTQKSIHADIVALYPRVAGAKCYFREPALDTAQEPAPGSPRALVYRDETICALVNKLVTTQHAILTLCELSLGDDAYALSRVALENAVIVAWLLNPDHWAERVDIYANSYSQAQVRLNRVVQSHQPNTLAAQTVATATTDADRAVFDDLFDGKWLRWAVHGGKTWSFKDMASEVFDSHFFYDRIFFETSWYVHSGVRSCLDIASELRNDDHYSLKARYNKRTATYALFLGNTAALIALSALQKRTPLGLAADIDAVFSTYQNSRKHEVP